MEKAEKEKGFRYFTLTGRGNLRLEVKQGAHPEPLDGIAGAVHVGYIAHKGIVCPAYVHVHEVFEKAGDESRWVEGLHIEEDRTEKVQGKEDKTVEGKS